MINISNMGNILKYGLCYHFKKLIESGWLVCATEIAVEEQRTN